MPPSVNPCSLFGDSEKVRELKLFRIMERVYPADFVTPDHSHENALFTFVLGGHYTEVFGTKKRECKRASALFHPGGEIHAEHFHSEGGRLFVVELDKTWTSQIKRGFTFPRDTIQSSGGNLNALGARAYAEFERFDGSSPIILEGLILEIVGEAARLQGQRALSKGPRWLHEVEDLLTERFAEPIELKDISKSINIHPVHIAQTFKKIRNTTVGERLREIRLENAREMLKFTSVSIAQVALRCGFSDQSHLSRLFKIRYGTTPRAYRNSV